MSNFDRLKKAVSMVDFLYFGEDRKGRPAIKVVEDDTVLFYMVEGCVWVVLELDGSELKTNWEMVVVLDKAGCV